MCMYAYYPLQVQSRLHFVKKKVSSHAMYTIICLYLIWSYLILKFIFILSYFILSWSYPIPSTVSIYVCMCFCKGHGAYMYRNLSIPFLPACILTWGLGYKPSWRVPRQHRGNAYVFVYFCVCGLPFPPKCWAMPKHRQRLPLSRSET